MKKILYAPFLIALLFSCQELEEDVSPSIPVQDALATRPLLPGDPNLDPNWNWESSTWVVRFSSINGTVSSPISIVNPFFNDPIYGNADPSKIDMRAADGWILVARDFGTPTSAPRIPYILLYNRYRGLLRVCAFKTSEIGESYQSTTLSFDNSTAAPPLFRFTGETAQIATTESGNQRWMVTEFNLQGYSASINQQARFIVTFRGVTTHGLTLEGGGTIDGVAQPKPSSKSFDPVKSTYKVTSHTSKFWDKLKDLGGITFKNAVKTVTGNPLAVLNAAAGIIQGFTSAGKAPTYNLSLEAKLALNGTMVSTSPRGAVEVYLQNNAVHSNQPRALRSIPWGVMNYSGSVPLSQKRVYDVCYGEEFGPKFCPPQDRITTTSGFFNTILVINPAIASEVAKTEVGWILHGQNSVKFTSLSDFKITPFRRDYSPSTITGRPVGVGVRITFKNGDVVYNRIPVRITQT